MVSYTYLLALTVLVSSNIICSTTAVRMPPRILKASTMSEDEHQAVLAALHKELMSLLPDNSKTRLLHSSNANVKMSKADKAHFREYKNGGSKNAKNAPRPEIVGVVKQLETSIGKPKRGRLGKASNFFQDGVYEESSKGFTWSLAVNSDEEAEGLSVLLTNVAIPDGVTISFFNEFDAFAFDTDIQNRVDESKEVWSKTVPGNQAFLVLHYAGDVPPQEVIDSLHFSVDKVRIYNPNPADDDLGTRKLIGDCRPDCDCGWGIADCVVDYMCCAKDADSTDPNPNLVDQECGNQDTDFRNDHLTNLSNSLAKMYWCDKGWCYSCSGGLINNEEGRTLVLTANHCIQKSSKNMELFFNAKNNKCEESDKCWFYYRTADTIGMTMIRSSRDTDFTLFEPKESLSDDSKTYYALGWNTNKVSAGDKLYRLSHPRAGPQSYTEQEVRAIQPETGFIYSDPKLGDIMSGSSGSPVVNKNNEIVGQLYGSSDGPNAFWCYTNGDGNDVHWEFYKYFDGEFAMTYNEIADVLGTVSPPATPTATPSASSSVSVSPSDTPSNTPSDTLSVSPTATVSMSPSATPSVTPSALPSVSVSPSDTPSDNPSVSPTATVSISPSGTLSDTPSVLPTATVSISPSGTLSDTPSVLPTATVSISPSGAPSDTPSVSPTATVSISPPVIPSTSKPDVCVGQTKKKCKNACAWNNDACVPTGSG